MKDNERKCVKCGSSPAEDPNITLHRFPRPGTRNVLRCELWAKYCFPHDSWSSPEFQHQLYSKRCTLCNKHFKKSSFVDASEKKLITSAAPDEECDKLNREMESDSKQNGATGFIDLPAENFLTELSQNTPNPSTSQSVLPSMSQPVLCITTNQETGEINIGTQRSTIEQPLVATDGSLLAPVRQKLHCTECGRFSCHDEDKMVRHIRKVHRGENPFQCNMCDYSTYNKVVFEEHIRIHKGIKPFKCRYCPHRNVSKKNLKRHEHIHRPDNPLKCPNCDHIARHKKGLECHASKCKPIEPDLDTLSCNLCAKVFDSEEDLILHTTKVRTCDHMYTDYLNKTPKKCAFSACSKSAMNEHKAKHKRVVPDKPISKKNVWKCALCTWSSYNERMILLHLIHHPNQTVDETKIDLSILRKYGIMA